MHSFDAFRSVIIWLEAEIMNSTLCTALIVIALVALRMLFMNTAWLIFPKSWQLWLFGKSYSPFRIK